MPNTVCSPSAQTSSIQSDGRSVVHSVLSPVMKKAGIALSNSSQESVLVCMMVEEFRGDLTSGLETIHRPVLVLNNFSKTGSVAFFEWKRKKLVKSSESMKEISLL